MLPIQPQQPQQRGASDPWLARSDSARYAILSARSCPPSDVPPFIYGVVSTKIYCRPTCRARLARRANVIFFETAAEAAAAGYRPCKRCRPDVSSDSSAAAVAAGAASTSVKAPTEGEYVAPGDGEAGRKKVIKAMDIVKDRATKGEKISLADLGKEVGLSKWHLLRVFRKTWGISPREVGEESMRTGATSGTSQAQGPSASRGAESEAMETDADNVSSATSASNNTTNASTPITDPMWDWDENPTSAFSGNSMMLTCFDEAFTEYEAMGDIDMDRLLVPESWAQGDNAENVLRDLFPELYGAEEDALMQGGQGTAPP